jgi:hypothetical protein
MAHAPVRNELTHPSEWARNIPDAEWRIYRKTMEAARKRGVPFAIGGAFAVATYTGRWRDTKDLDLYVLPQYREAMIAVLNGLGLADYHRRKPYDRWWIYRAYSGKILIDVIWAMANHRAQIDDLWMSGPEVDVRGVRVQVLPPEALMWDKLYIMQRDRCDWPDALNLIYNAGASMNWDHLLFRIGEDLPLLAGLLSIFRWIDPARARELPPWIWQRLGVPDPEPANEAGTESRRADLLDMRPWFGPDRASLEAHRG